MKKNMGSIDKTIRLTIALLIIIAWIANIITGVTAIVLVSLAAVFLITSTIGICPLYNLFGIKTYSRENR